MTLSLVVLFGIALFVCIKKDDMKPFHAIIAVLFGLFLGTTNWGPKIMQATQDFLGWLNSFNF
ncbi:hypothetical protein SEA_SHAM_197 [Streptomyces phage Sham]|uniref:Membrane protein n=1 Tax=Streptomyces phage TunaTartare TaxID=2848887 RepID=A0A8F2E6Z6_9CAUD|nr:membrane protein [Streptomyces phage TunaTartare]QWT30069.1 membrane protein [Streptomyces phage TunaTartare]UUG69498.1 hypothetical protein SEA_SHAM_197 [Streptomyces phage Sham]